MTRTLSASIALFMFTWLSSGCQDLKDYRGKWSGKIDQSRLVRRGLDICSRMELDIRRIGPTELDATLQLVRDTEATVCSADIADEGAVLALPSEAVDLTLVPEVLNDSLANLELEGEPLFTHVSWIRLENAPILVFLSVFRDTKLEVRMVSPDAYASFRLKKVKE